MGAGVYGINDQAGIGVNGQSQTGTGVRGVNMANHALGLLGAEDPIFHQHAGVYGHSDQQGVIGTSSGGTGVFGSSLSSGGFGVRGESKDGVAAIQGQSFGTAKAAKFIGDVDLSGTLSVDGDVAVTGDVLLINRGDIAERFEVSDDVADARGYVMSLNEDGKLTLCCEEYDVRAVGIATGAGPLRPGLTLEAGRGSRKTVSIALVGTAYCWVDTKLCPVKPGDLLTTSSRPGHAMKALADRQHTGAIVGKSLASLHSGTALLPVLVMLR
jgi:hypothetical protein